MLSLTSNAPRGEYSGCSSTTRKKRGRRRIQSARSRARAPDSLRGSVHSTLVRLADRGIASGRTPSARGGKHSLMQFLMRVRGRDRILQIIKSHPKYSAMQQERQVEYQSFVELQVVRRDLARPSGNQPF